MTNINPNNILLGEGAIYFNYGIETKETVAGVTRGNGKFEKKTKWHEIDFNGKKGKTKGMTRKIGVDVKLTFGALELCPENLEKYYADVKVTSDESFDIATGKTDITEKDYLDNVAFVGKSKGGKDVIIVIKNALGDGDIEMAFKDDDEVVDKVEFSGTYDPEKEDEEPWEIRWGK